MIVGLTLLVAAAALIGLWRGHYIFAAAVGLIGSYELTGPLLQTFPDPTVQQALAVFGRSADPSLDGFINALGLYFLIFVATYVLSVPRGSRVPRGANAPSSAGLSVFPLAILVFGIISVVTGAGQVRLEADYSDVAYVAESSRFFSYGGVLLVVVVGLMLHKLSSKNLASAIAIGACLAPLVLELFIAGRRQWFAPSAFLVLIALLYSRVRFKLMLAAGLLFVVATVFAFQFALRQEVQQTQSTIYSNPVFFGVLAPQFGEFIGIGATSLEAWEKYVIDGSQLTYGVHWAFHTLNTIPFLRLGDEWFPEYSADLYRTYNELAPWGGLSMIADSLMAAGVIGMFLLALVFGWLCRRAHDMASRTLEGGVPGDATSLYYLSLTATLLLKYRSGVGDAIQSAVSFSILYFALVFLGAILLHEKLGVLRYQPRQSAG